MAIPEAKFNWTDRYGQALEVEVDLVRGFDEVAQSRVHIAPTAGITPFTTAPPTFISRPAAAAQGMMVCTFVRSTPQLADLRAQRLVEAWRSGRVLELEWLASGEPWPLANDRWVIGTGTSRLYRDDKHLSVWHVEAQYTRAAQP